MFKQKNHISEPVILFEFLDVALGVKSCICDKLKLNVLKGYFSNKTLLKKESNPKAPHLPRPTLHPQNFPNKSE
ncbi:MAG: hypothetical protein AAFZ15_30725 [Bacteroidota bacterium]